MRRPLRIKWLAGLAATALLTVIGGCGGVRFTGLDSGAGHACGVTESGQMYCWGRNDQGQIGDGSNVNRFTPVPVSGDLTFRALGGGDAFMCGITTGGSTWCWGSNRSGEIGDPSLPNQVTPVQVEGLPELRKIYGAGGAFTLPSAPAYACGLTANGEAWCWGGAIRGGLWGGANYAGQLGDGTGQDRSSMVGVVRP